MKLNVHLQAFLGSCPLHRSHGKAVQLLLSFSKHGSIHLTGQVVLNISQFCQRTVELLRTT